MSCLVIQLPNSLSHPGPSGGWNNQNYYFTVLVLCGVRFFCELSKLFSGYWKYRSVLMMLELSERLFSDVVSFFACTLYVVLTDIFRLRYSVFYFHLCRTEFILSLFTLGWGVVVFVLFLDYTHFQTNTCRLVPL